MSGRAFIDVEHFRSTHHPGTGSWALVYSRALVGPLATSMLPVMIFTLVAVLEGHVVVPDALWAGVAAVVVASMWTSFGLHRRVAEIRIDGPWATVLSVADVIHGRSGDGRRVLDVRDYGAWADVTVGLTSYDVVRDEWPRFEALIPSLRRSRQSETRT